MEAAVTVVKGTTNPIIIMLINMSVVFGVLLGLGLLMQIIHWIDPTKKKVTTDSTPAPAPAAAISVAAQQAGQIVDETLVIIAAAIAAYGYNPSQIVSIRPVGGQSWAAAARTETVQTRNQMF